MLNNITFRFLVKFIYIRFTKTFPTLDVLVAIIFENVDYFNWV